MNTTRKKSVKIIGSWEKTDVIYLGKWKKLPSPINQTEYYKRKKIFSVVERWFIFHFVLHNYNYDDNTNNNNNITRY